MSLAAALQRIAESDPGPQVVACFDYDGTVINGYSAGGFYRHRLRRAQIGPLELARTLLMTTRGIESEDDFRELLDLSLGAWRGRREDELLELGARVFTHDIASRLHTEVWQLIEAHHQQGHTVALASSATRFQVEPMGRELGAHHVLCTSLEVRDGRLTGRPAGRPLWGLAKADALLALAGEHGLDLDRSFAYTNGTEDIPLLESVGFPLAVEPEEGLLRAAGKNGWPVLRCQARGATLPAIGDVVRTAAFYGGMFGGLGVGAGIGLLKRSRTTVLELGGSIGADVGLALAGVDVEVVEGREHLWSSRPCVFVFNHQSKLDPIVVMKLLREGWTGVGKQEVKRIPVFGQVAQLAGVALIERGNTDQAKRALAPAVRRIREDGISLAIAPEGTRSATPRLGRFKKGAFHIAMQAQVPIVPIVLRNVGEVMWRGAQTIKPGRVEVRVLDPVDTTGWTVEGLDEHIAAMRERFVEALSPRLEVPR